MTISNRHDDDDYVLVRAVVDAIEAVRMKRRRHWRGQPHLEGKRFTQEELGSMAYPSYHNMLVGKTRRLPSRQAILRIADYLECTHRETNDLLAAAQYLPHVVELPEDEEQAALEQARALVHTLPLPAGVIGRGWIVAEVNALMLAGNGMPRDYNIAARSEITFDSYGDPAHPAYRNFSFDHRLWRRTVRNTLHQFRDANQQHRREPWYQALLKRILALPGFTPIWETLDDGDTAEAGQAQVTYNWSSQLQTYYRDALVRVPIGRGPFPIVGFYYPVDEAGFAAFRAQGCPVAENGWEHTLALRSLA